MDICAEDARTVEWNGTAIGRGRHAFPFDEVAARWPDDTM